MPLPRHSDQHAIGSRDRPSSEPCSGNDPGQHGVSPQDPRWVRRWPGWVAMLRACLPVDQKANGHAVDTPKVAWAVGSAGLLSAGVLLLVQRAKLGWLKRRRKKVDTSVVSTYDAVTGLPTLRLFLALTHQALARAQKAGWHVAVVVVELAPGPSGWDLLIQAQRDMVYRIQAARLKSALRTTDTVARLDERSFAALIDNVLDLTAASAVAEKLQAMVSQPCELEGTEVTLTGRIGIAVSSRNQEDAAGLLDLAVHAAGCAEAAGGAPMYAFPTGAVVPVSQMTDWPDL